MFGTSRHAGTSPGGRNQNAEKNHMILIEIHAYKMKIADAIFI